MENQIVKPLETVGGEELLEMQLPPKEFVIEGLLPKGLAMIVGATKIGKSFLSLQVALAVSSGEMLWSFPTHKGHVLYLALEDDYERLQMRIKNMNDNVTDSLRLSLLSETIGTGLLPQIDSFLAEYPDTNLVIIDTLQHVRDNTKNKGGNLYAQDYSEQMLLQRYALDKKITILLIHHTNKLKGRDPITAASGTTGMTAALDTYWYLDRPDREKPQAKLTITSRDIGYMVFKVELQETGEWTMLEGPEFRKKKINPYVAVIATYIHLIVWGEGKPYQFQVTAKQLEDDIKACNFEMFFDFNYLKIKKELTAFHAQLENLGILFDGSKRTGKERLLTFTPVTEENAPPYYRPTPLIEIDNDNDSNDGMTEKTDTGEKCSGTVTDISDDGSDKNDSSFPLSEKPSLLSQPSQLSQVVHIDAFDPISFLAKVMQHNLSSSGVNITPFEGFCKQQEEKERKKKEAEQKYIDVKFSDASKEISVPVENKITLYGKNKVDAAVIFLKAFLLRARLKSA